MATVESLGNGPVSARRPQCRRDHEQDRASSWTLSLVDAGIASSLLVVPFFMGGRTPVGQLVFAGVAFWTCLWWAIHQTLGKRRPPLAQHTGILADDLGPGAGVPSGRTTRAQSSWDTVASYLRDSSALEAGRGRSSNTWNLANPLSVAGKRHAKA